MSERLRSWLGFSAIASAIGWADGGAVGGSPAIGASVGLAIGASLVGLELFLVELPVGAPLRRLPLPWFVTVMTTIWIVIIALCLQLATVGALAASANAAHQLRFHVGVTLRLGVPVSAMVSVLGAAQIHAGIPAACNGLIALRAAREANDGKGDDTSIDR